MRRLRYLCSWLFSHLFKSKKRRCILSITCVLLFVILRRQFICTIMEPHLLLTNLCTSYARGQSIGKLCQDLCHPEEVPSLSCHNIHQAKELAFIGIWKNYSAIFKSVKKASPETKLQYWLDTPKKKNPTENEFLSMINSNVKLKFNMSINAIDAKKMSYIEYNTKLHSRNIEMENIWTLVQDNEYLALLLYEKFNIFPKLLGTCGSLYAVQKLNSISRFWHLMSFYDSREEWEKRIRISVLILDFLMHLQVDLPEPLLICNVDVNSFGVTDDFKKVMYVNLDSVHPISVANRITGDGSQCKQHSDCDFSDCRSLCNLMTFKCEYGVVNNNLQIVCEKIFLGWVMSGKMMIPGLLLGPRTPRVLIELLELCANPTSESGTPRAPATKEIRKRLYNLLVHLKLP